MKKRQSIILILIAAGAILFSCSPAEKEDLLFFYFESCPSCDNYKLAEEYNEIILLLNKGKDWNAAHYNLITPESAAELKKILEEKGLPDISRSLPLLITGNEYINGYEAIGEKLEQLKKDA
ncbi:MAG: hypothetical protein PQJ58_19990 [Spirochaetales bacterium]|nr:hypothetical protein [Spirochaetales bacterium]